MKPELPITPEQRARMEFGNPELVPLLDAIEILHERVADLEARIDLLTPYEKAD